MSSRLGYVREVTAMAGPQARLLLVAFVPGLSLGAAVRGGLDAVVVGQ